MRYRHIKVGYWRLSYRVGLRTGFSYGWRRQDAEAWSLSLPVLFVSAIRTNYR
jgi:hypothetical protein